MFDLRCRSVSFMNLGALMFGVHVTNYSVLLVDFSFDKYSVIPYPF